MYFSKQSKITKEENQKDFDEGKTLYGLPREVIYCKKCVISNQRPNSAIEYKHLKSTKKRTINFNEGICDACHVAEKKHKEINWKDREEALMSLCDKFRSKDGSHDCIVPGSGGKDSFYASYILKYKFKMNPLTITWAPLLPTEWGRANMISWTDAGMDNLLYRPNRRVQRLLTRISIENLLHPFQSFMFGQKMLAPKLASKLGIGLIFYGENQAEYGNDAKELKTHLMADHFYSADGIDKKNIFIGGLSVNTLQKDFNLCDNDLSLYLPINKKLISSGISVAFLSHFVKWHPQSNYYFAKEKSDFVTAPERLQGTYTKYISTDDKMEYFNFYTLGIKFGIGWTSNIASHEIRDGDLSRTEGINLVKKYDHEYPSRYIQDFLDFVSLDKKKYEKKILDNFKFPKIDKEYFDNLADTHRSPHIWKINDINEWELRHSIFENEEQEISNELKNWKGNK